MRRFLRRAGFLCAVASVAVLAAGATTAAGQVQPVALVSEGTVLPGAPGCPMFPADNIWNTDISKLPVDSHSTVWLRSMDASTTFLHPDFGPDPDGYPYGIPYEIVTSAHKTVKVTFLYASQSNRVPYPLGPETPIEGGKNAPADTDRHALMVNQTTCTLYELWQAHYSADGSTAGSGAVWNLRSNALRPADWTSADAAGLPILPGLLNFAQIQQAVRTGKPITHAIRFTAQVTADAYIWPAGPGMKRAPAAARPRRRIGGPLPAQRELRRRGLLPQLPTVLRGRQGGPGRNAALRPHTRRQRQQLVLLGGQRRPAVARCPGVPAQANPGQRFRGGQRVLPHG